MNLLLALLLLAAPTDPDLHRLETGGIIADITVEDVNNSGRRDVVILAVDTSSEPPLRWLAVFLNDGEDRFPRLPSFTHALSADAGGVFFAEKSGTAPREMVVVGQAGADVYGYSDNGWTHQSAPRFASLYPAGFRFPRFLSQAATDLTGDGREEWIIPTTDGFTIHNGEEPLGVIPSAIGGYLQETDTPASRMIYHIPEWKAFPVEGHARKGLVFLGEQHIQFATGADWGETQRIPIPSPRGILDRTFNPVRRRDDRQPRPPGASAQTRIHDFTGNGLPDILVMETEGGMNAQSVTALYFAQDVGVYPDEPDAIFERQGSFVQPSVADIDGDDMPDLLFVEAPFGVRFLVNYFVRNRVTLRVEAYQNRNGRFGKSPDLSTQVSLTTNDEDRDQAFALGDFFGDDRMGAVFGNGDNRLAVFRGSETQLLESAPVTTLDLSPYGIARAVRLCAQTTQDALLVYWPGERTDAVLVRFDPPA